MGIEIKYELYCDDCGSSFDELSSWMLSGEKSSGLRRIAKEQGWIYRKGVKAFGDTCPECQERQQMKEAR